MNLKEMKRVLYETLKGASVPLGYEIEMWKDEQYPFVAHVRYENKSAHFISKKEARVIKSIKDIKIL